MQKTWVCSINYWDLKMCFIISKISKLQKLNFFNAKIKILWIFNEFWRDDNLVLIHFDFSSKWHMEKCEYAFSGTNYDIIYMGCLWKIAKTDKKGWIFHKNFVKKRFEILKKIPRKRKRKSFQIFVWRQELY